MGDFYLAIGRLTKQKKRKFSVSCECFKEIIKKYSKIKLIIIGDGESYNMLSKFISQNQLSNNIFLLGHKKMFFHILKKPRVLFYPPYGKILVLFWLKRHFVKYLSFHQTLKQVHLS